MITSEQIENMRERLKTEVLEWDSMTSDEQEAAQALLDETRLRFGPESQDSGLDNV